MSRRRPNPQPRDGTNGRFTPARPSVDQTSFSSPGPAALIQRFLPSLPFYEHVLSKAASGSPAHLFAHFLKAVMMALQPAREDAAKASGLMLPCCLVDTGFLERFRRGGSKEGHSLGHHELKFKNGRYPQVGLPSSSGPPARYVGVHCVALLATYGPCWLNVDHANGAQQRMVVVGGCNWGQFLSFEQPPTRVEEVGDLWLPPTTQGSSKLVIMHACHESNCVQPAHLAWGTKKQNKMHTPTHHQQPDHSRFFQGPTFGWVPALLARMEALKSIEASLVAEEAAGVVGRVDGRAKKKKQKRRGLGGKEINQGGEDETFAAMTACAALAQFLLNSKEKSAIVR